MRNKDMGILPILFTMFFAFVLFVIIIVIVNIIPILFGVNGWGPTNTLTITVSTKHIDTSEKHSHYMVTSTDGNTYEVNNGFLLIWNADEIYGRLKENKTYTITTKGNKVVNWAMQEYPYIISAQEIETPAK